MLISRIRKSVCAGLFTLSLGGWAAAVQAPPAVITNVTGGGFSASRGSAVSALGAVAQAGAAAAAPAAPVITQPPVAQTVPAGTPATFTVFATGTAPLSYQWYKNAAAVGSATQPVYTISSPTVADDGASVYVTVTDVYCGVTASPPVVLHVTGTSSACDLNSDGSVSVLDVQSCVNQAIGIIPCTTCNLRQLTPAQCTVIEVQRVVNAALGSICKVGP